MYCCVQPAPVFGSRAFYCLMEVIVCMNLNKIVVFMDSFPRVMRSGVLRDLSSVTQKLTKELPNKGIQNYGRL